MLGIGSNDFRDISSDPETVEWWLYIRVIYTLFYKVYLLGLFIPYWHIVYILGLFIPCLHYVFMLGPLYPVCACIIFHGVAWYSQPGNVYALSCAIQNDVFLIVVWIIVITHTHLLLYIVYSRARTLWNFWSLYLSLYRTFLINIWSITSYQ